MDKIGLWKRIKTGDAKRYGLKISKFDKIMGWLYTLMGIGGIIGYFVGTSSDRMVWLVVAALGALYYCLTVVRLLKNRVRELGGDIFYPEDKESK
jgi:hypothetical protein